jgi:DNA-binding NtrC family response regulator
MALNADSALAALEMRCVNLVLVAEALPDGPGIDFIRETAKRFTASRFVLVADGDKLRKVVDAIRSGAHDFLSLPLEPDGIPTLLERLGNDKRRNYKLAQEPSDGFENIITASFALKRAIAEARQVAPFDAPVLIQGDSGTGKELFARAIHSASRRANSPIVSLNCANLPEALLESQLFGHVRGAFTGADQSHTGFVGEAAGGTLFLDEIGELGPNLQAKLLRFLQEGEYRPLGAGRSRRADIRFIAATNVDLCKAVERGIFRADLYYRLAVFPIVLVPLRERREDITLLTNHFVRLLASKFGCREPRIEPCAAELLINFEWPGNVRQLVNVLERALILYRDQDLDASHLAPLLEAPKPELSTRPSEGPLLGWELPLLGVNLEALERDLMLQALARAEGNVSRAATLVGLTRAAFRYRIGKLMDEHANAEIAHRNLKQTLKQNLYDMVQRRIN